LGGLSAFRTTGILSAILDVARDPAGACQNLSTARQKPFPFLTQHPAIPNRRNQGNARTLDSTDKRRQKANRRHEFR
jgi:hypothetical protein